ncbi:conserved hypothetical protein [Candida dubliniensis CD36]|uniref:Uncharacterized protein n=1 Tax=Candida dubliniensis (strain CD36 / ATCC MYA-646 / CBS 7987 / NCPF 3949 / NRRL Y-17841) TaxID=573826 RepID=B9WMF7_CANDC|nr:conserved hypothetical protein [Candida dubliniensis CD36]CAX40270.1 conserved hypothetical protein [Candida dubliniensis CD36]
MVEVLATGTTVPQDRIKSSQRWLSYLHFVPNASLMRDASHYEKSFKSVDHQQHLPRTYFFLLNSTTHNIVSPIPQNIVSYK